MGSTVVAMSHFGNVPVGELVDAVEKLVAKMDEGDLVRAFATDGLAMPPGVSHALIEAIFDAFRERGESSEDAAEESGASLDGIERLDPAAVGALLAYAGTNPGVVKEATTLTIERHPEYVDALPAVLRDAIARRLTRP